MGLPVDARYRMMAIRAVPTLTTPGVLAAALEEPLHRVVYVLRTRPHIRPAARAGRLRLYDRDAIALIRHELNAIDARATRRKGAEHE